MNPSRSLLELQKLDRARDEGVVRLRAVLKELQGSPEVKAARAELEAAEDELQTVEPKLRANDLERQGLRDHIKAEEAKLYGGKVTAPKELQNLEMEIASLKRRLGTLDDAALELMEIRDEAADRAEKARERLTAVEKDTSERNEALDAEKAELAKEIRSLEARRKEAMAEVRPGDLPTYRSVRKRKGGVAVAEVNGETCTVCGIQVPRTTTEHAASGGRLVMCPGCGRILCA